MSENSQLSTALNRRTLLGAGAVGFAAVITQLVMMRELTAAFAGNELVFGISLGAWLLLTAAGAWLGRWFGLAAGRSNEADCQVEASARRRRRALWFAAGLALLAIVGLFELAAVRGLRDVVFTRGAAVGVGGTILGCLVALAPFCLCSGLLLTLGCVLLSDGGVRRAVGPVYAADAVGSVGGGLLFTFVLARWFDPFASLILSAYVTLGLAAWLAAAQRGRGLALTIAAGAAALTAGVTKIDLDAKTTAWQHSGEIVWASHSPYGRLVVTRRDEQLTFFENGVPIGASNATAAREETVHYAMVQRPNPRRVLLIGGLISGAARETLRYPVTSVTCLELDPQVVRAVQLLRPDHVHDARLKLVTTDGRRYLQRTEERFDVVILDTPDPATLQLNRLFTAEFFAEVKRRLVPGGVMSFGLGRYDNFVSAELAALLSSARQTLLGSFAQVVAIPGGRVFFLASDGPLTAEVAERLEARGVSTKLVRRSYLEVMLAPDRRADLERAMVQPARANRDFAPVLYHYHLRHWLAQFDGLGGWAAGVVLLASAAYFLFLPAVPRVLFASGFTASGLEVVLLLALQVRYGTLYQHIGVVVALFMAGLAAGAAWSRGHANTASARQRVAALGAGLAGFGVLLAWGLPRLAAVDRLSAGLELGQALIPLLAAVLGAAVGAQFPAADEAGLASPGRSAARLFGADLTGSAAGALLVSAWLIPAFGVATVCLLTAALNAIAAGLLWWRCARYR